MSIVLIDNYDSFTYNLVQYLGSLGVDVRVFRNDAVSPEALDAIGPRGLVLSPGPGRPGQAGISIDVVRHFTGRVPVLGVCLGHQAIAEAFGAEIVRADRVMHGKTSPMVHTGQRLFSGLANPFVATRYHSLVVDRKTLPDRLEITCWTPEGVVMGLRVRGTQTWGVQFHPESILTTEGLGLLRNFLGLCDLGSSQRPCRGDTSGSNVSDADVRP